MRQTTGVPLILDESATDVGIVLRAKEDGVLDGLNLKLAKVGGISKMRLIRDLCVALRVPMEIQDSSYSELACAVVAHMGHSTPASNGMDSSSPYFFGVGAPECQVQRGIQRMRRSPR